MYFSWSEKEGYDLQIYNWPELCQFHILKRPLATKNILYLKYPCATAPETTTSLQMCVQAVALFDSSPQFIELGKHKIRIRKIRISYLLACTFQISDHIFNLTISSYLHNKYFASYTRLLDN